MALTSPPPPGRPATLAAVAGHPGSRAERDIAAPRHRWRRSASVSQPLSAAARASGSSAGTRQPGRSPPAPAPNASGTPPTSVATTGTAWDSASAATIP